MDNKTGNICLLTYINSKDNNYEMEYSWGTKFLILGFLHKVNNYIKENYTEIGYL